VEDALAEELLRGNIKDHSELTAHATKDKLEFVPTRTPGGPGRRMKLGPLIESKGRPEPVGPLFFQRGFFAAVFCGDAGFVSSVYSGNRVPV
jgi:hypothetical protein